MHQIRRAMLGTVVAVVMAVATTHAQDAKRDHDITVDDYFTQANLFQAAISPSGGRVAYTDGRWQESTGDRKADLWVVDAKTQQARRLTFDRSSVQSPKWSQDERSIYFTAKRKREAEKQPPLDGTTQVWRISPAGREPLAVTRVKDGISLFDLAADGKALYYTTDDKEELEGDWKELKQQFKDVAYGHGAVKYSRIWKLDLQSWRTELVLDKKWVIRDMSLSPDGRRLALITTPDDTVVTFEGRSKVEVLDLESKKVTTLPDKLWRADAPSPYGWLERLAWSASSKALAFTIVFDGYPAEILVAEWAGDAPTVFKLQRPEGLSLRGYGSPLHWRGKASDLCFLGEEKARVRLCCVADVRDGKQGALRTLTPGDVVVEAFDMDASGERAAIISSDPTHLQDIYLVEKADKPRRLTQVNPQAETWKLPQLSTVSWKGANGDTVEGILELPPDHKPGQKLPLVVEIHGGPTTATYFQLQYWIYGRTLLPAKGYAVLSPNYRGSTGYGDKFLTALIGHENDVEVEDILKGVDAMIERGIADPERLGVMGWSNGGYLTNCIIARTTRFKAASSGAGIVDTVMEWGINDEPAYPIVFKQGFPWNRADAYRKTSPTYSLDKVRTPTLIHVGGNDERCPPGHSRMLYRALKEYGKVPTELLVYPDESHGIMKYKNRKAKLEWDLAWFDRHIRGKGKK
jgi:dipeptidyl aminopeptidase/acylaminoacyl peptidase